MIRFNSRMIYSGLKTTVAYRPRLVPLLDKPAPCKRQARRNKEKKSSNRTIPFPPFPPLFWTLKALLSVCNARYCSLPTIRSAFYCASKSRRGINLLKCIALRAPCRAPQLSRMRSLCTLRCTHTKSYNAPLWNGNVVFRHEPIVSCESIFGYLRWRVPRPD